MEKSTISHIESEIIRRYPNECTKDLAADLGITVSKVYNIADKFRVKKSKEYLNNWALSGRGKMIERGKKFRFKKGHESWNKGKSAVEYLRPEEYAKMQKTQFKPGDQPHNTKHDGAITLRNDKSGTKYLYIRISKGNWIPYHVKIYQDAYGPIPKNHIIVFKDFNSLNVKLDNLLCISRAENMKRNSLHRLDPEIKQTIKVLTKLKKTIKNGKKQNQ